MYTCCVIEGCGSSLHIDSTLLDGVSDEDDISSLLALPSDFIFVELGLLLLPSCDNSRIFGGKIVVGVTDVLLLVGCFSSCDAVLWWV